MWTPMQLEAMLLGSHAAHWPAGTGWGLGLMGGGVGLGFGHTVADNSYWRPR